MNLFKKKKYVPVTVRPSSEYAPHVPDGLWVKCIVCGKTVYGKETGEYKICPHCGGCFRLSAGERIEMIFDEGSFKEINANLETKNPLSYPGYEKTIAGLQKKTGLREAVVTGKGEIAGLTVYGAVMDSNFMMASMGSVVGEKMTRLFEKATEEGLPVVAFTASGGARMQEGIISLMQMAKVSAAVNRHHQAGLLYITVITDPTTGGVTASFAMQGDIILAEPKAVIGFAGRRVIEQTMKHQLPKNFQTAELVLENGFIDKIVPRPQLKETLIKLLRIHNAVKGAGA